MNIYVLAINIVLKELSPYWLEIFTRFSPNEKSIIFSHYD